LANVGETKDKLRIHKRICGHRYRYY